MQWKSYGKSFDAKLFESKSYTTTNISIITQNSKVQLKYVHPYSHVNVKQIYGWATNS